MWAKFVILNIKSMVKETVQWSGSISCSRPTDTFQRRRRQRRRLSPAAIFISSSPMLNCWHTPMSNFRSGWTATWLRTKATRVPRLGRLRTWRQLNFCWELRHFWPRMSIRLNWGGPGDGRGSILQPCLTGQTRLRALTFRATENS